MRAYNLVNKTATDARLTKIAVKRLNLWWAELLNKQCINLCWNFMGQCLIFLFKCTKNTFVALHMVWRFQYCTKSDAWSPQWITHFPHFGINHRHIDTRHNVFIEICKEYSWVEDWTTHGLAFSILNKIRFFGDLTLTKRSEDELDYLDSFSWANWTWR